MQRSTNRVGWALTILWIGAACIPKYQEPEVRLNAVRLGALGMRGGTIYAHLVVINPNRFTLQTQGMTYELDLGDPGSAGEPWVRLASGTLDRDVRIAAGDSAVVELPVDFTYDAVGSAMRAVLRTGTIDYRLSGDLQLHEPLRRRVPFRRSGQVDLMRTP